MSKNTSSYSDLAKMALHTPAGKSKIPRLSIKLKPTLVHAAFDLKEPLKEPHGISLKVEDNMLVLRLDPSSRIRLNPPIGLCPNYHIHTQANMVKKGFFRRKQVPTHTAKADCGNTVDGLRLLIPAELRMSPTAKPKHDKGERMPAPKPKHENDYVRHMQDLVVDLDHALTEREWDDTLAALAGLLNNAHRNLGVSAKTTEEGIVLEREVKRVARYTG